MQFLNRRLFLLKLPKTSAKKKKLSLSLESNLFFRSALIVLRELATNARNIMKKYFYIYVKENLFKKHSVTD